MVERRGPHEGIVQPDNQQVKASVEIFVPVARKFTLNYHGEEEPSGQEYTIALDVLQDADLPGSALDLPLRMIMGSGDYTDLIDRCMEVIKAGYIAAKGELVIDHQDGAGESPGQCIHLVDVHWFDAVEPMQRD
jgi:hypothetical protein